MNDVDKHVLKSAEIVKVWGQTQLPNGKSLAEHLTIDGFSLWDVMAPVTALYYVPVALSGTKPPSLAQQIRPRISLAKHRVLNLVKRGRNRGGCDVVGSPFLFMGFSGYMYRDVLRPVAEYLAQNKGRESVVLHDEFHLRNAPASMHLVRSQSIWSYWNAKVENEARELTRQLWAAVVELRAMDAFSQLIQADGESLWLQMQNDFNWFFNFHLPLLVPQIAIARRILKHHRPALIISADVADVRARVYSLVGHQLNIPSLEIQFGPSGAEAVEWRFLLADHIATWGETTRQALLELGVQMRQITITGSPRHDSMVNVEANEVSKTRARLGVPVGHALVLCASTYQQKEYNSLSNPDLLVSMKRAVFKSAGEVEGLCLVVKPHPLENVQETRQLIGTGSNIILVDTREDIRELTKACDVFIGFGSTATVDAMIGNKLTICPAFSGWIWSDMFVKSNAVLVPRSEEELLSSFRSIVNGSVDKIKVELEPARLSFLQKWTYKIDGRSSERAAMLATEIAVKSQQ
jgi:hypothetical protein